MENQHNHLHYIYYYLVVLKMEKQFHYLRNTCNIISGFKMEKRPHDIERSIQERIEKYWSLSHPINR